MVHVSFNFVISCDVYVSIEVFDFVTGRCVKSSVMFWQLGLKT
jgi:hypothetical protein